MYISIEYKGTDFFSSVTGYPYQVTAKEINSSVKRAVHRFIEMKYPERKVLSEEITIKKIEMEEY